MPPGLKPSVSDLASKKAYGFWVGPKQHFLARGPDDSPKGPTYTEAIDKFRKPMDQDAGKGTDDYMVSPPFNQ